MENITQFLKRVSLFTHYSFPFQCENHFSTVKIRAIPFAKTITTKMQEYAPKPGIIAPHNKDI